MENVLPVQWACLLAAAGHPSLDAAAVSQEQSSLQGVLAHHSLASLVVNTALLSTSLLDPCSFCCLPPAARILPGVWYHLDSSHLRDRDLLINSGSLCWDRAQNTGGAGGTRRGLSVCPSCRAGWFHCWALGFFFPMTFQWMSQGTLHFSPRGHNGGISSNALHCSILHCMLHNPWETCIKLPVTCGVIWHQLCFTQGQEELRWSATCSMSWAGMCEALHCPLRHMYSQCTGLNFTPPGTVL